MEEVIALQEGSITSLDLLVALLGFRLHCLDEELRELDERVVAGQFGEEDHRLVEVIVQSLAE